MQYNLYYVESAIKYESTNHKQLLQSE